MQDTSRLEALMNQHGSAILRFCTLQLRDAKLAEDAAQDVFVKAWKAMDRFQGRSSEKTWLYRIAINTCRDYQRTGWFRWMDRSVTPEDMLQTGWDEPRFDHLPITRAVQTLPPKWRTAVYLRYCEGMKLSEVAALQQVSEATVKRWLSRAAAALRQELKGWYDE
ncbi:MAG: sigma-70 family RNA polymerase sigma factor [Clostridiales bacterium]|nr:sigma-70 family RNA polymerase sigma factor [Clostridiales bacterium]